MVTSVVLFCQTCDCMLSRWYYLGL